MGSKPGPFRVPFGRALGVSNFGTIHCPYSITTDFSAHVTANVEPYQRTDLCRAYGQPDITADNTTNCAAFLDANDTAEDVATNVSAVKVADSFTDSFTDIDTDSPADSTANTGDIIAYSVANTGTNVDTNNAADFVADTVAYNLTNSLWRPCAGIVHASGARKWTQVLGYEAVVHRAATQHVQKYTSAKSYNCIE